MVTTARTRKPAKKSAVKKPLIAKTSAAGKKKAAATAASAATKAAAAAKKAASAKKAPPKKAPAKKASAKKAPAKKAAAKKVPAKGKNAAPTTGKRGLKGQAAPDVSSGRVGKVDPAAGLSDDAVLTEEDTDEELDAMLTQVDVKKNMDKCVCAVCMFVCESAASVAVLAAGACACVFRCLFLWLADLTVPCKSVRHGFCCDPSVTRSNLS